MYAHSSLRLTAESNVLLGDVQVFSEDGTLLSDSYGARMRYLDIGTEQTETATPDQWFYRVVWEELEATEELEASEPQSRQLTRYLVLRGFFRHGRDARRHSRRGGICLSDTKQWA